MKKRLAPGILLCLAALVLFAALYRWDNKYTAALSAMPGVNRYEGTLGFIVDGWEYYPGLAEPGGFPAVPGGCIYIGQEPGFSGRAYGEATYRIVLEHPGPPEYLSLYLPEILSASRVYIGGKPAGETGSVNPYHPLVRDTVYSFMAGQATEIVVQAANYSHYYSGLYYPPAVGQPQDIAAMVTARAAVYGLLCFGALAVALSNLALWAFDKARRDSVTLLFGILCAAFALWVSYPFFRMMGIPAVRLLYAVEDGARAAVLYCAVLLTAILSKADVHFRKAALSAMAAFCCATVVLPVFILPYTSEFINFYGPAVTICKLLIALWLLAASIRGLKRPLGRFLLAASLLFGFAQLAAVLSAGFFEPIRGAWPEEYGGFALVIVFGALMVRRGRDMAAENARLTDCLQEEVEKQTAALTAVLTERKRFLAQIVHDVKTPMASVRNYADLIRKQKIGLDDETLAYLDAMQERVETLNNRFSILREFSTGDRVDGILEPIFLNKLISEFYRRNRPDLELDGQNFTLRMTAEPLTIRGDKNRLWRVLENLCYNAASFTEADDEISLSLERDGQNALVTVADTGQGIPPEALPHVFEQGFTFREDGSGSGLGLFIARSIVLEHGGEISAASEQGKGAVFTIRLPLG